MTELYRIKTMEYHFHVYNDKVEPGIGSNMIICRDLMVQLGLLADFKRQFIQWDGSTLTMKEPSGMLVKSDLTSIKMREAVMQTAEPASTLEDT